MIRRELPAATLAVVAAALVVVLAFVGSQGFRNFDAALIGYFVAVVFATAAIVYRYTLWITRPPTWLYFKGGWQNFFSWRNFRRYTALIPVALWRDIFAQTFILKRGFRRWAMHQLIFWGVLISLLITLPLTFGWLRFTLIPPDRYLLWFFGFPVFQFPVEAGTGFAIFHALDVTALLLIAGVAIALLRRTTDVGLLTIQRFGFDLMPLVLLFAIAVTGLALTASSLWFEGAFYWFISLTHQVVVVAWLLSIPFGKFFHIVQRPASVGVTLYQVVNQDVEHYDDQWDRDRHDLDPERSDERSPIDHCKRCGTEIRSRQFVEDLKANLVRLNQNYDLGDERGWLQDYCPTCKRVLRGEAYYHLMGKRFL